jgi:polysaccharide deacetylase family protein (PEP-CTERM system associated)
MRSSQNHAPKGDRPCSVDGSVSNYRIRGFRSQNATEVESAALMFNVFSVDVEDYFHPSEVQRYTDPTKWATLPSRVDNATRGVLDLLDLYDVKATFFVLGWVAEHHPKLVLEIARRGHEIACHSYAHQLVFDLSPAEFRADTKRAVRAIEEACGVTAKAYRAPSYSITESSLWALEILAECGFTHDSSICPVVHDRYGIPGFGRHAQLVKTPSGPILEVPVATVQLSSSRVAPVGGGAYLRLFPYRYTAAGIRQVNRDEAKPACIYIHPWELDVDQPRLATGLISRIRTYAGLSTVAPKLRRLLKDFRFSTLTEVCPFETGQLSPEAVSN